MVIQALKLCASGSSLQREIPLSSCERLASMLLSTDGNVILQLNGLIDEGRHRVLTGSVQASVLITCQKCLEPVQIDIQPDFKIAVLSSEDYVDGLPEDYEPYVHPEGEVDLIQLVEDEILLNLPIVALHDEADACLPPEMMSCGEVVEQPKRKSPFTVLESLKRK